MSRKRNRSARRERRAEERRSKMDAANHNLTYDELSDPLQRVVMQMAMAYKRFGKDEEEAVEIAARWFCTGAREAKCWDAMYRASRAERMAGPACKSV